MKRRIELRPRGAYTPSGAGFLPVLETWCEGMFCHRVIGNEIFADPASAATFAETRALGTVDELMHHYGDVYTFSVRTVPCKPRDFDVLPLPSFLTPEFRELHARAVRRAS